MSINEKIVSNKTDFNSLIVRDSTAAVSKQKQGDTSNNYNLAANVNMMMSPRTSPI